jgi:hypothetical protein
MFIFISSLLIAGAFGIAALATAAPASPWLLRKQSGER